MHQPRNMQPARRAFLKTGAAIVTATATGGVGPIGLGSRLVRAAWPPVALPPSGIAGPGRARSCILLYMEGGPSQLDTFDPKPGRPTGGPYQAIETTVSGVRISEHLPRLARQMKRLALVRSLTSKEGNHNRARHLMHTGYPPQGGVDHPAFGSLVAQDRAQEARVAQLPGYVTIGGPGEDAGFLGAGFSPFPVLNPTKPTRNLNLPRGVDRARFDARMDLWRGLEDGFAAVHDSSLVAGQRDVGERAVALMRAPGAAAFDLSPEPDAVRQAYGDSPFGCGCLMARRLVTEGVPFVEVMLKGWDTHDNNFPRVRELSGVLDQAMSALLDDLSARGLLQSTLIVWLGDFGRTPRINERGGRDHFPAASSVVLAGGGITGGTVVGATSADGDEIVAQPVTVPHLYRSIAWAMNLDADRTRLSPSGRPLKTVDGGALIPGLF
jgi:hypothetical protein